MTAPQLTLKSVTGVDVELQIAGPGSRSYAFVIDWHIRLLLSLLWMAGAMPFFGIFSTGVKALGSLGFIVIGLLPAILIYFFYHLVLELIMRGRTPGKRIAGVRLVTNNGEIPSAGAILIRNLFRLLDSFPAFYVIGLSCVMFTRNHVRVGDLAAGTLLVIDATESEKSLAVLGGTGTESGVLNPQEFELVHDVLERWPSLNDGTRRDIARTLLTKIDPLLTPQTLAASTSADLLARLRGLLTTQKSP
jgi:uncharacterized RDD family membrane protein YckC